MQEKAGDIANACRLLGVSRSGYYAARQRALAAPRLCPVSVKLQAAFARSGRSYGSRRLLKALRAKGLQIGRHRVRRLMREHQLRTVWRRKFVHTTDSRHGLPVAPNVLDRQFDPVMPNRAWVTDITYVRTRSGWLYLAAVMDLFSRKIVGWAMAPNMQADLVCSALRMAITQRQPPAGLIVHSRIARVVYGALEPKAGIVQSQGQFFTQGFLNHRVLYEGGVLAEECSTLLSAFFASRRKKAQ